MTSIILRDPESGDLLNWAIDGLTHEDLLALPLDDLVCSEIAQEVTPCLPEEFLAAYVARVGVVAAGFHIFHAWIERKIKTW